MLFTSRTTPCPSFSRVGFGPDTRHAKRSFTPKDMSKRNLDTRRRSAAEWNSIYMVEMLRHDPAVAEVLHAVSPFGI
jgi:hypothetical protein